MPAEWLGERRRDMFLTRLNDAGAWFGGWNGERGALKFRSTLKQNYMLTLVYALLLN